MANKRSRRFILVVNNYTEEVKTKLKNLLEDGSLTYLVWGEEIAPTTGTPHLQGYLETAQKKTLKGLQKVLTALAIPAALLIPNGTQEQNVTYCKKGGLNVFEAGTLMKQGDRSDLSLIVEKIRAGSSLQMIWEAHPTTMIIHRRGVMEAMAVLQTSYVDPPIWTLNDFNAELVLDLQYLLYPVNPANLKGVILWGESGKGKTTLARCLIPKALVCSHLDDLKLLNEQAHDGIIFDDMSFSHLPRESQIHLVDNEIGRSIHCRYGNAYIPSYFKKIFTTNLPYSSIFLMDPAIARRVTSKQFI